MCLLFNFPHPFRVRPYVLTVMVLVLVSRLVFVRDRFYDYNVFLSWNNRVEP